MKIVLIGYMGSGKSSIGKALSSLTNAPFLDLDREIEKEEGKTISKIFDEKGEIYFRKREQMTLFKLLEKQDVSIIASGGGTPCYGNVMQLLAANGNVKTIFLKASQETLTQRLFKEKDKRPLISHLKTEALLQDFIRKHLFERNFYYFKAERTVVVDDKTLPEIVEEIIVPLF